jgi:hypothetical protein
MAYHKILIGIGTAALLSMLVFGCSTRTIDTNVGLADAGASSSSTVALCGTWQGSFWHVIGDHTSSPGSSDLTLQVSGDSTYTFKWGNRPRVRAPSPPAGLASYSTTNQDHGSPSCTPATRCTE